MNLDELLRAVEDAQQLQGAERGLAMSALAPFIVGELKRHRDLQHTSGFWGRLAGRLSNKARNAARELKQLKVRNEELVRALRHLEDVCVDEGVMDEAERETKRVRKPATPIGRTSVEMSNDE